MRSRADNTARSVQKATLKMIDEHRRLMDNEEIIFTDLKGG